MKIARALLSTVINSLRALPKLVVLVFLLASLALNVASLTFTNVYTVLSSALSTAGFSTVAARRAVQINTLEASLKRSEREVAEQRTRKKTLRKISVDTTQRAKRRVQRGAARNISSAAGEAIPFLGVAVIAGALALEINDACETAEDMAGLQAAMETEGNPELAHKQATETFSCVDMIREEIPDYQDLPTGSEIWTIVKASPAYAWEQAKSAGVELVEYDWSGTSTRVLENLMNSWDSLFDWVMGDEGISP